MPAPKSRLSRGDEIELADQDRPDLDRDIDDAEIKFVNARAHEDLRQAFDDKAQPERRHEQGQRWAVDQRPQHHPLDHDRERDHHDERDGQRRPERERRPRAARRK